MLYHSLLISSKYHQLNTVWLVILCAIAGASSRNSSNATNKTSPSFNIKQQYRASFIDFLLDASFVGLLNSTSKINRDSSHTIHRLNEALAAPEATKTTNHKQQTTICGLLSNLLNGNQLKFCHKHLDVLEIILPQVMQLTRRECSRVTADLRWNCYAIDSLLDRSNPLAFTKEAALVRSILNAAMMYLVVKTCSENRSQRSCGCNNNYAQESSYLNNVAPQKGSERSVKMNKKEVLDNTLYAYDPPLFMDQHDFSSADLSILDSGSPLKITSSVVQRQGCLANTAFADAFTRVFIDSDDTKASNRAYKILNEDQNYHSNKLANNISLRRLVDSDNKDLAYIKWTKSAISLHNNNVGRQMVRKATKRKCRCHGLSGVCPFQTCWDQLLDFETVTNRLKLIYLAGASRVEVKNIGSLEAPDLCLTRLGSSNKLTTATLNKVSSPSSHDDGNSVKDLDSSAGIVRVKSQELIYLHNSPEYCEPIPQIGHPGTRGRPCEPMNSNNTMSVTASEANLHIRKEENAALKAAAGADANYAEIESNQKDRSTTISVQNTPGSCEHLCCNRGCRSELILDMVTCNCRFKFCCKVECDHCLRQRVQHFCL